VILWDGTVDSGWGICGNGRRDQRGFGQPWGAGVGLRKKKKEQREQEAEVRRQREKKEKRKSRILVLEQRRKDVGEVQKNLGRKKKKEMWEKNQNFAEGTEA
jgi:hypothetical protein